MDKKSFWAGMFCIIMALCLMLYHGNQLRSTAISRQSSKNSDQSSKNSNRPPSRTIQATGDDDLIPVVDVQQALGKDNEPKYFTLGNDSISLKLSNLGGTIQSIVFSKYPMEKGGSEPFIFNKESDIPALSLSISGENRKFFTNETVISQEDSNSISFLYKTNSGLSIERSYSVPDDKAGEKYLIKHSTKFINHGTRAFDLRSVFLELGSFPPTASDYTGEFLNFSYYDGRKAHFLNLSEFDASSGFLGFGRKEAREIISGKSTINWGSVKNQFFAAILRPNIPASGFLAFPVKSYDYTSKSGKDSVSGSLEFNLGILNTGETKSLDVEFYTGPKDFVKLDRLGHNQDLVMQFGFFGFIGKILLLMMRGIHSIISNWGLTIIILTMIVKLVLWPLTTTQVRSSRRMAKIQGPMRNIKEKFKDNPQKLQTETMKLFKENKINPAAGCLPIFIQIPIFLGLYSMLRTTSDLRFAEFLWIKDLSMPDTLARLGTFPINLLPFIMALTTYMQMKMMPSPSIDNVQKKMFQFMPIIFMFFCYNLPSGLVLYWTVQNLFTMLQQSILNNKNLEVDQAEPDRSKKKKRKI
ncbi:MAG: membrane protein insertase YidC [Puniceicoccales bacterium]|jgi:YidC/Oxa1 family membrane protein insertase|nr:membrane protein insertase YidC [Puniceicoccales bacterium]